MIMQNIFPHQYAHIQYRRLMTLRLVVNLHDFENRATLALVPNFPERKKEQWGLKLVYEHKLSLFH